ncbi:MAG: hypothetical protein LBB53_02435 [Prevotellaceae bacterium]|nr:hypothetical protein [Prevotellaceae bacterium]
MNKFRIFISSVQSAFADDHHKLVEFLMLCLEKTAAKSKTEFRRQSVNLIALLKVIKLS